MADKPLQLVSGRLTEVEATTVSAGPSSAGDVVALNANGKIDSSMFYLPEYGSDPVSPQTGDAWVRRTTSGVAQLSHTLLQIGLTAPGVTYTYELRFRTLAGTNVTL